MYSSARCPRHLCLFQLLEVGNNLKMVLKWKETGRFEGAESQCVIARLNRVSKSHPSTRFVHVCLDVIRLEPKLIRIFHITSTIPESFEKVQSKNFRVQLKFPSTVPETFRAQPLKGEEYNP